MCVLPGRTALAVAHAYSSRGKTQVGEMSSMKKLIIQMFSLAFLALGARAEELRLVDQNGLIRALKIDAKVSPVEVTLVRGDVGAAPSPILLSRVDGINAPLVGELQQGTPESLSKPLLGVVFRNVHRGFGDWRLSQTVF